MIKVTKIYKHINHEEKSYQLNYKGSCQWNLFLLLSVQAAIQFFSVLADMSPTILVAYHTRISAI